MRFNELRWGHLAIVLERVKTGDRAGEAALAAGIPPGVWNRARKAWAELPEHLAKVDPEGLVVDLDHIDELVFENRTKGGRPPGSKDQVRRSSRKAFVEPPALIVKSTSVHVEDGMFYDD